MSRFVSTIPQLSRFVFTGLLFGIIFGISTPVVLYAQNNDAVEPVRGLIKSLERTQLSSEISGRIIKLPYRAGDSFNKGDTLVTFDCQLFEAERDKMQAREAAAKIKVAYNDRLQEYKSVGLVAVELDKVALRVAATETRIASLAVKRCLVRAPFSGRVVVLGVNQYQTVKPQQPLLEIISTRQLEVEAMIPSDWLRRIKPGESFTLRVDETGDEYEAEVEAVGAAVDPVSKMVLVRGALKEPGIDLVPGMGAAVFFSRHPAALGAVDDQEKLAYSAESTETPLTPEK